MYAIILNGPPGIGKDTIADRLSYPTACFKDVLVEHTCNYYSFPIELWKQLYTSRQWKEQPNERLDNLSPRQALIHVSEDIYKPEHGKDYFGQELSRKLLDTNNRITVVTDGGFEEEVSALRESGINVIVIRLREDGFSFDGDSRSYLFSGIDLSVKRGEIDSAVASVQRVINQNTD